jgi:hypothetical protein
MALIQVTVTETKNETNRQFRGTSNGKNIVVAVGEIPEDWVDIEVYEDDQDRILYCIGREPAGDNVTAHRWTPNGNVQKVEQAVPGGDPLADVLQGLLGAFPADTPFASPVP